MFVCNVQTSNFNLPETITNVILIVLTLARGISPLEEALRSPSEPAKKCESTSNYFYVDFKSTLTNSFLGAGSVFLRKLGSAFGPYGSNHDSVTRCNNNGGNDKQNQRN